MPDTTIQPTRLLKWVSVFARWLLGLLLAMALLLTLAWGALHGWIVPRIGDYRSLVETKASAALGLPLRLGSISARSEGLFPTLELADVALLDAQGRVALRLPQITLVVSPRSLLRRRFQQIHVRGLDVDVRRSANGSWWVAGMDMGGPSEGGGATDWLLSQPEVVVRGGRVRWTDELRGAPALALEQVDLTLRSRRWRHSARLDATPPPGFGERFSVVARMREPVLALGAGGWHRWSGQVYASFPQVDLSQLGLHADLGPTTLTQGSGALRVWGDIDKGAWTGGAADVAIAQLDVRLKPELEPLRLRQVQGRLGGQRSAAGFRLFTQGLRFMSQQPGAAPEKDSGEPGFTEWPGGNVRLDFKHAQPNAPEHGEVEADQLDLAALARIAARVPLPNAVHAALGRYSPQGVVEHLNAGWQGPLDAPLSYQAKGRVVRLAVAASAPRGALVKGAPPGLRGASVDFDLNHQGGKAELHIVQGALLLPTVFENPLVPLDSLRAQLVWKLDGERISVEVARAEFANADAAGTAQASWHTSDPATSPAKSRFPGVLDLKGSLSRGDGTRVHRYLPLAVPASARHYVRDAILAGRASAVDFRVRGDLYDMPFAQSKTGQFRIASRVQGVTFAYVPPRYQAQGDAPWPALVNLSGELIFEGAGMQVKNASGGFEGFPEVKASGVQAEIADLEHSVVKVNAAARGPLTQLLGFVRASPVSFMTGKALEHASGTGDAELALGLQLPIAKLSSSTVQGDLKLTGNDVRITPDTPLLARTEGSVQFTESGFSVAGAQASALGGDVRIEGGMRGTHSGFADVEMRAQGTASAQGLQEARELGLLVDLARKASGSARYDMTLRVRRGVPEIALTTDLQGMSLHLPDPLRKDAQSQLPVRFENQLLPISLAAGSDATPLQERLSVDIGTLAHVQYERRLGAGGPTVLRGSVAVGVPDAEQRSLPTQGVQANLRFAALDIDAWQAALAAEASSSAEPGAQKSASSAADILQSYLPTVFALQAQRLNAQGRTLHGLVVGGSRLGRVWRANLDAQELAGYLEYRQAGDATPDKAGVYARLSRLAVPESASSQVDALLDEQPDSLPGLDIVVDAFELRGRKLGRLEIDARNMGGAGAAPEWHLAKFNLAAPEASFTANGNWARVARANGPRASAANPVPERRTALGFTLNIRDAGALLARMGMEGVVRQGQGRMDGRVSWQGAPTNPDYHSMAGQIHLDVGAGQFLQADPGLAKLLGVLSLQSLPRRLALDFRDVFSKGFAFDFVRGDVAIERGVASTNNLQMKGVNAAVLMEGSADIEKETQDLHVVVVPEIDAMTASLVATAINPVLGLGTFLAQAFLRGPLMAAATQEFSIRGTWSDPDVTKQPRRRLNEAMKAAAQPLTTPQPLTSPQPLEPAQPLTPAQPLHAAPSSPSLQPTPSPQQEMRPLAPESTP